MDILSEEGSVLETVSPVCRRACLQGSAFDDSRIGWVVPGLAANFGRRDFLASGLEHLGQRVVDAVDEVLGCTAQDRAATGDAYGASQSGGGQQPRRKLLGCEPEVNFMDGFHWAIEWYFATKDRVEVRAQLKQRLTER